MEQMHARYEKSGLTLTNFCESENINKYTFQYSGGQKLNPEKNQNLLRKYQEPVFGKYFRSKGSPAALFDCSCRKTEI